MGHDLGPVGQVLNTRVTVSFSVSIGRMGVLPWGRTVNQEMTREKAGCPSWVNVHCSPVMIIHVCCHWYPFCFRDTAGQERFRTITTAYYRGAMGIMLVYDITNEKSFDNIRNWIRNIEEHASADVEKMILGNKCDVNDKRQVSKERGEKLALDYGIKFMETSAKANINVENAFFTLARDIKAKMDKKLEGNSPQGSNQGVKITPDQQKRSSFFRCVLL